MNLQGRYDLDPARAERIAARFDRSEETIRNREFLGFRATVGGVPIGVCSTGIGGPSASTNSAASTI